MPPRQQQSEEEDWLSVLTDDILLSILARVDLKTAARTSVLSTWWVHLPWLLPELSINAKEFLSGPCRDPDKENDTEEAMASLTKAARSFLADQQRDSIISSLHLHLYLIKTFLYEDGPLVSDAIDSGLLKDLDLAILDETVPRACSDVYMVQRGKEMDGFFSAYPSVLHCLTKLSLRNLGFNKLDMHHILFDCCKQLKHLSLYHCDNGASSWLKIDAPNSKLSVLELTLCRFERLEVVCLPKLEKLSWDTWMTPDMPLAIGFIPSLGELVLSCGAVCADSGTKLSELLHATTSIHTLSLDFQGESLWLQPEMKQLCTAFKKLRKLSVRGIFVEFDILWTMAFLVAAPSIEMLQIEVWEHACDVEQLDDEDRRRTNSERRNPEWEMDLGSSKNWFLKELEFVGFRSLEQQFTLIRSVLERSPNLQKIFLKDDEECDSCAALGAPSKFPKKDDQEMVIRRITDGTFSPQIIFDD
uniref:Uncharacterized protein n=1 Tax=Avena sativa TaxID=4498 RepID=A0ACD5WDN4_AVESA